MAEDLLDAIGPVLSRWTVGGAAAAEAPAAWRGAVEASGADAELRLIALAGQFLGAMVAAEPPGALQPAPDLPVLALPTLPGALRPLLRRLMQGIRDPGLKTDLLGFVADRGWSPHPADWLPGVTEEDLPAVYAPWQDWVAGRGGPASSQGNDPEIDDWSDLGPAARIAALAQLRKADPTAARDLLSRRIAGEAAELRVRLVDVMAARLSDEDRSWLEALQGDRAPRVRAAAAALLARLGHGEAGTEDAAELAGFFAVGAKGLIRRSRVVSLRDLKTPAQRLRLMTLFSSVDIGPFAAALGLSPEDLLGAWRWGVDTQADIGLATAVERSAPDALLALVFEALLAAEPSPALLRLRARLTPGQRARAAERVLDSQQASFDAARFIGGPACRLGELLRSKAGVALLNSLNNPDAAKPADPAHEWASAGLLASPQEAQRTLERLMAAGLTQGDPRLDALQLNARLPDNNQTTR